MKLGILQTVFVHDPVGPLATGGSAEVEDEGFLHADNLGGVSDGPVFPGGLPVALNGGAIGAGAIGVLAIEGAEEVPLHVAGAETREGGEIPRLPLVEINLGDGIHAKWETRNLALQVIAHQLFIGGVKTKARSKEAAAAA